MTQPTATPNTNTSTWTPVDDFMYTTPQLWADFVERETRLRIQKILDGK